MFGEPLIQERIVGIQQVEHAAILADDALEEHLRLALEGHAQIVVEVEQQLRTRLQPGHVADVQPLAGEVVDQRLRARVRKHAPHLLPQNARIVQRPLDGHVHELVVRNAAPQEEREA